MTNLSSRKTEETNPARLAGLWAPSTADDATRSVEVIFTAGADVLREDYMTGEAYWERLRVDHDSVNLERLHAGAPVLDAHNSSNVRSQIGVVDHAWIANGKGHARIRFSERASDLYADVKAGIVRGVSIGYQRDRIRELDEARDGHRVLEVERFTPFEISLVPIAADIGASTRTHGKEARMTTAETRGADSAAMPRPATEAELAALNEKVRKSEIRELCTRAKLGNDFAQKLIDQKVTLDEARGRVIDAIADPPESEIDTRFAPGDGAREADFARIASAAILHRERIEDTKDRNAIGLASRSMLELARMAATMDGVGLSPTAGKREIATRALTSSTLGEVVALTAGRSLAIGYESTPRVFAEIFRESSASNFRPKHVVKLSDIPTLPLVAEGDAYGESTLTDSLESYSLASYGSILSFTRQLLINDDVDAITRAPQLLGSAAAARESAIVWGILNTNGNMADTNPIFGVGTSNLATDGLDAAALETAREAMMSQATENSRKIGLQPAWLVVGPDLLTDAEKLVRPPVAYSESTLANTLSAQLANQLQLRVDPVIPTGTYYLFCDSRRFDSVEYSYLAGQRGAYLERETDFDTGAIRLKATLDFGCVAVDRRGMYRVNAT